MQKIRFVLSISMFILVAFFALYLNLHADAEHDVFTLYHLPRGWSILHGEGYPYTYPLWGYPLFVALVNCLVPSIRDLIIPFLQVGLMFAACLWVVGPSLRSWLSLLIIPLCFPVFFHAAVKWADAPYLVCWVILFGLLLRRPRHWWITAGVCAAIASNLRPDFLYLSTFVLICAVVARRPAFRRFALALFVASFLSLVPWWLHTGSLSSSNGGLVAYISLGQLPGNPWGRVYADGSGFAYARANGLPDPYTPEGNNLLFSAAARDVRQYPAYFVDKVLYNLASVFSHGVYGFNVGFFFSLVTLALIGITATRPRSDVLLFVWSVFLFTVAWVIFLQYIDRHLNGVYILVLLMIFSSFPSHRERFFAEK